MDTPTPEWMIILFSVLAAFAAVLCGVAAYRWRRKRKRKHDAENQFREVWSELLRDYDGARVYNGLYGGLRRVCDGKAKRPERVLREWCQRTRYRWEGEAADKLCASVLLPAAEAGDYETMSHWTKALLDAAHSAGITTEREIKLILDESNVNAYADWDGETLYVGDSVEVLNPAWYHGNRALEQGQCKRIDMEDNA